MLVYFTAEEIKLIFEAFNNWMGDDTDVLIDTPVEELSLILTVHDKLNQLTGIIDKEEKLCTK